MRSLRTMTCRPGLTFLETVVATALLAVVAATTFSTFSYIATLQIRDRQRLAAAELAGRLILIYLDDPRELPVRSAPIKYGPPGRETWFRWELATVPLELKEQLADPTKREARELRLANMNFSRLKQLKVKVWLAEDSGGSPNPDPGVPEFTMTRLYDPFAYRNPSTIKKLFSDPARFSDYIRQVFGEASGMPPTVPGPTDRRGGAPKGGSPKGPTPKGGGR